MRLSDVLHRLFSFRKDRWRSFPWAKVTRLLFWIELILTYWLFRKEPFRKLKEMKTEIGLGPY